MSIAISVPLQPSRTVQALQYGLVVMLLASAVGVYLMPDLAALPRYAWCAVCILASSFASWQQHRQGCNFHVTISHEGSIYLSSRSKDGSGNQAESELVTLLAGSTIWPSFMLLRLRNEAGRIYSLALMPDSTSADNFRALAVAVRWIIRRKTPAKS